MARVDKDEVRRIGDALHEDISDVLAEFMENHSPVEVLLAFLGVMPHLIGKSMVVFDDDDKKQAIHEFVYAVMSEADKAGKAFDEFIDRGE